MGHCPVPPPAPDAIQIAMNRPNAPIEQRLNDAPRPVVVRDHTPAEEGITPGTIIGAALIYGALNSVWGEDS